jgi:hypothetical protein
MADHCMKFNVFWSAVYHHPIVDRRALMTGEFSAASVPFISSWSFLLNQIMHPVEQWPKASSKHAQ